MTSWLALGLVPCMYINMCDINDVMKRWDPKFSKVGKHSTATKLTFIGFTMVSQAATLIVAVQWIAYRELFGAAVVAAWFAVTHALIEAVLFWLGERENIGAQKVVRMPKAPVIARMLAVFTLLAMGLAP